MRVLMLKERRYFPECSISSTMADVRFGEFGSAEEALESVFQR